VYTHRNLLPVVERMKRLLSALLAISLIPLCAGCGNIFLSASSRPGFSSASGLVSIVQLSTVIGTNGATVQVTFVTFLQQGTSSTVSFCGDQGSRFPMNQMIRTDFIPGQSCSSILVVVII
jgi:hypothetical protein